MYDEAITAVITNVPWYVLTLLVFILWDFIDLFIQINKTNFIWVRMFWVYVLTRFVISLVFIEMVVAYGIAPASDRLKLAIVVPLGFMTVIQNFAVKIGGDESLDLSKVFEGYRAKTIELLRDHEIAYKIKLEVDIYESNIPLDKIIVCCRFHFPDEDSYAFFKKTYIDTKSDDREKRLLYIKQLIELNGEITAERISQDL